MSEKNILWIVLIVTSISLYINLRIGKAAKEAETKIEKVKANLGPLASLFG